MLRGRDLPPVGLGFLAGQLREFPLLP